MVLNDGPDRSCCWSSTLRSQDAKLTLTEAIAEWIVRAIDIAHRRLDRTNRVQIGGDIQAFVSDVDSHLELFAAGHSFSAQLGIL